MSVANGVYTPGIHHPPPANLASPELFEGVGAPSDSIGHNGDVYIDNSTGDIYVKTGDTWILGGGAGSGQLVAYTTTGPTADGVVPDDLDSPALAIKPQATIFTWDKTLHVWDDV